MRSEALAWRVKPDKRRGIPRRSRREASCRLWHTVIWLAGEGHKPDYEWNMFSKHRLEALSDGVFAIVMTLLILDIKVPVDVAVGGLGAALARDGHAWVSFGVTFLISSIFWNLQRKVFDLVDELTTESLVLTFVFLGLVMVLPFSTSLWGHYIRERLAFVLYFGNQLAIAIVLTAKLEISRLRGHLHHGPEASVLRLRLYVMCAVMASAAIGALVLPINRVWIAPLTLGVAARIARRIQVRRMKRLKTVAAVL